MLQETIIIKVKKTKDTPESVTISSTNTNKDFDNCREIKVPYELIVSGEDKYVYLVTSEKEVEVLRKLNKYNKTLPDLGLRMKTGLTVDFRNRDILRDEEEEGTIPLFYSQHIKQGQIKFPIQKEHEYILTDQKGLMQENKNYLLLRDLLQRRNLEDYNVGFIYLENFHSIKKSVRRIKLTLLMVY